MSTPEAIAFIEKQIERMHGYTPETESGRVHRDYSVMELHNCIRVLRTLPEGERAK